MIFLKAWQQEFIKVLQHDINIINLYGPGGCGKSFFRQYYNKHDINYIEYEELYHKNYEYKDLIKNDKKNIIISLHKLPEIVFSFKAD